MSLSMYDRSVPVLIRGLNILSSYMDKAAAHATERNIDPSILVNARLAPDMMPLAGQVQRASDNSKNSMGRFTGVHVPSFADNESTFAELKERISKTVEFLQTIKPEQMENTDSNPISLKFRNFTGTLSGESYLLQFLLPNFFFHIATAHDILRHNGVGIGKVDYIGSLD